jgi:hypothetical protein
VFDYYITSDLEDPERRYDNLLNVLPVVAAEYGDQARPAASYLAPFLIRGSFAKYVLPMMETITGSHEFAERYLNQVVTRLPSSEQADRATEVLKMIAELKAEQIQHRGNFTGPFAFDGDSSGYGRGAYEELIRGGERGGPSGTDSPEVAGVIAKLRSSELETIREALVALGSLDQDKRREILPHLLPLLTHENEEVHRPALQGLADARALDVARQYLERRLAEAPADEDVRRIARMLKWVNALIEYPAQPPGERAQSQSPAR